MDINQDIKFLIDIRIQDILGYIVEDEKIEYDKAIDNFYNSKTFLKLTDVETGIYLESSAFIYSLYKAEMQTGNIPQTDW